MNIIHTGNYVAGIFADWCEAQRYLLLQPASVTGFVQVNTDLSYPFYLLETNTDFRGYQTEAEARAQDGGRILYMIEQDYQPSPPWSDTMGNLDHEHLIEDC
jgi:hypothetical protein